MRLHVSLITLGVEDLDRARRFYAGLGLTPGPGSNESVVFFETGTILLALYGRTALAEDAGVWADGGGFRGITLAHNAASREAVDAVYQAALAAGAVAVKPPQPAFWGGYSGYFSDPDGHLWEVAHNPFFPLDDSGHARLS